MSQGGDSNRSGQFLEQAIENEFKRRGVKVFAYIDKGDNGDIFEPAFLLKNVPYTSIYGCKSRSEFVYRDFRLHSDIRIECRWQQSNGSVDEKLPYLLENAKQAMPEQEIWLIVDGGGARDLAVDWLKRQAAQVAAKTIRVLTVPEARQRIKYVCEAAA